MINGCVHDGRDILFCYKPAAIADDWCFHNDKMSISFNRKYKDEICPSDVAHRMVSWNMKVNIEQFCDTFKCGTAISRRCFAQVGLRNPAFKDQYNLLFGKGEFEKRTA